MAQVNEGDEKSVVSGSANLSVDGGNSRQQINKMHGVSGGRQNWGTRSAQAGTRV